MSIFQKTRQCTGSFPCRFRLVLVFAAAVMTVSIATVPVLVD